MLIALTEEQYFELKIIRKHNRYAYLRVKPNRVIEVCAPMKMPQSSILELVHKKKQWIIELSDALGETYDQGPSQMLPVGEGEMEALKLKAEARAFDALERVYPLVKPYGIPIPEIHIRYMTSKWGSCVVDKGRVWLNAYLVKLPEVCMDYVLLRQLLQFQYAKQDAAFYKALGQAMPQWKASEEILKNIKLPQKKIIASSPKLY